MKLENLFIGAMVLAWVLILVVALWTCGEAYCPEGKVMVKGMLGPTCVQP